MSIIRNTSLSNASDLIFYLDAVNPRSYSGSGSIWFDLSSNGNHFTLFNSPTYVQNGTIGTYLTFNGTNQYARSTNAINFNAYSAVTIEIGYRTTVTNGTQIIYETTGTGGSTATGGITLLMNANGTGTVANTYLSMWQGYGVRAFGFRSNTNTSFNSVAETFVNGSNSTGRQALINGTTAQFFTNTAVTVVTSATTAGLVFANTWTFVASRAGTGNFFRGDIAYIRAWGRKLQTADIVTNSISAVARQPSSYQNFTILTGDPSASASATLIVNGTTATSVGVPFTLGYTGNLQYFDISSASMPVKLEAYGGAGGRGRWNFNNSAGAPGGYAAGNYVLTPGRYYVFVGQGNKDVVGPGGSGGGSTDVRVNYPGGLSYSITNFLDNTSLNSRILVAGGGGGSHGGSAYGEWPSATEQPGRGGPNRTSTNSVSTSQDSGHVNTGADSTQAGLDGGSSTSPLDHTANGAFGRGGWPSNFLNEGYNATGSTRSGWGWPNGGSGTSFANGGGGGGWYGGASNWPNGGGGSNYLQSSGIATLSSTIGNTTSANAGNGYLIITVLS
jgi:hypothetical protein